MNTRLSFLLGALAGTATATVVLFGGLFLAWGFPS